MLKDDIAACCRILKLGHGIVDNCEVIKADSNQEYLLKLLQLEIKHRDECRKERLLKNAGFYSIKTFNDYSFDGIQIPQGLTPEEIKKGNLSKIRRT